MSIKIGLNVQKDISKALISDIKKLTKTDVLVGIPATGGTRQDDGANNALIGYVMETGDPERNIPARPFLVPGVDAASDEIGKRLTKAADAALDGRQEAINSQLNAAGLLAQSSVKSAITNGEFAPLSGRTLAARKARGRSGDKPLIDTGQLRRSVTYIVRKKGQK